MFLISVLSLAQAQCPTDETIEAALSCSSNYYGVVDHTDSSHLGGSCNTQDCYSCGDPHDNEPQVAPEAVYTFFCQNSGNVVMEVKDLSCDLDIYVLDDTCDPYSGCLQGSTQPYDVNDSVQFNCTQGQLYYIVVEAYGTSHSDVASGPCIDANDNVYSPSYTLSFDVSASTGCAEDCDDGMDNDLDGFFDCDDSDCASDCIEQCFDGVDNDSDGSIDCADQDCWSEASCCDQDGDGALSEDCLGTDCDDSDPSVYENAPEDGSDGIDNDCDGEIDESTTTSLDNDGDGFSTEEGDCNDEDPNIFPGSEEILDNGLDDDCDGQTDEDSSPSQDSDTTGSEGNLEQDTKEEQGCNCQQSSVGIKDILSLALLATVISFRRRD